MAIVRCVNCNHRMSDKAPACPSCGYQRGVASQPELTEETHYKKRRERLYRLTMLSYVALTVFLIGAIWYLMDSAWLSRGASAWSKYLLAVGMLGYFVLRVMMIYIRRQSR